MTKKLPTIDQLTALRNYRNRYGRNWKMMLNNAWINGKDARELEGHLLRQVRNQLGPTWLNRVNIDTCEAQPLPAPVTPS